MLLIFTCARSWKKIGFLKNLRNFKFFFPESQKFEIINTIKEKRIISFLQTIFFLFFLPGDLKEFSAVKRLFSTLAGFFSPLCIGLYLPFLVDLFRSISLHTDPREMGLPYLFKKSRKQLLSFISDYIFVFKTWKKN